MRLFAAVDLSGETREAIAAEQQRIRTALGESGGSLKWVGVGNAHLTLVFLGQVAAAAVPSLADDFSCDIALPPFEIAVSGLGMFPERGAPRVLWLGIGAGAGSLIALQRAVAVRVAAHRVALEARDFHPHLTLARWGASRPADRALVRAAAGAGVLARQNVASAALYHSQLLPGGARYTALAHANLTGA